MFTQLSIANPNTNTDPNANANIDPNTDADAKPHGHAFAEPHRHAFAEPHRHAFAEPDADDQPDAESDAIIVAIAGGRRCLPTADASANSRHA